jgi:hypothetical protein
MGTGNLQCPQAVKIKGFIVLVEVGDVVRWEETVP